MLAAMAGVFVLFGGERQHGARRAAAPPASCTTSFVVQQFARKSATFTGRGPAARGAVQEARVVVASPSRVCHGSSPTRRAIVRFGRDGASVTLSVRGLGAKTRVYGTTSSP